MTKPTLFFFPAGALITASIAAAALSGVACSPRLGQEPAILDVRPEKLQRGDQLLVEGQRYLAPSQRDTTSLTSPTFRAKASKTTVILDGTFTLTRWLPCGGPECLDQLRALDTATARELLIAPDKGVLVSTAVPGSALAKAGLFGRDVIRKVDNRAVTSLEDLRRTVGRLREITFLKLTVFRRARMEFAASPVPVPADPNWAERILLPITAQMEHWLGQAIFEGRVGVSQQEPGIQQVTYWTSPDDPPLRLAFFQPSMQSLADRVVDVLSHGRVQSWLGIAVRSAEDGLDVVARPDEPGEAGSLARKIGLNEGDRILSVNGRPLRSAGDLTLAFRQADAERVSVMGVKRGGRELTLSVPVRDKPLILPTSVIYLLVMLIFGVVALTVAMVISGVLTWVERRVAGRMQSRVGPNRVGPLGALQWLADGIKLLLKEDIIPDAVDRPLFKLAPYLVFMGLLGTFVVIPFGQVLIISDLNVGLIYLIAITGFVAMGLMMAGWSSNNKWALLGGMRSAAQIISYEIPAGLALMVPVILSGTLSTQSLVENQGGWPWQWHVFDNPFIFICFFIYFVSALAEGNRTPFDLPEAESELVAGYNIEYSGWRFAVFFLSEWANLFVVGAVATTVFLGGWQIPGVDLARHAGFWGWQLLGLCFFFAKAMSLVFVIIWIRWTLPRFRVDQMMGLCWKYFVPWTFAAVIFQALWIYLLPPNPDGSLPLLRLAVQVACFLVLGMGLIGYFFYRVWDNWRQNPEEFSWKQFY